MYKIQRLTYRLLSGFDYVKINNKKWIYRAPGTELLFRASIFCDELYERIKFGGMDLFSKWELVSYLEAMGLWTYIEEDELSRLNSRCDNLKQEIYEDHIDGITSIGKRQDLRTSEMQIEKLLAKKHAKDHLSIDGYIAQEKVKYLVGESVFSADYNQKVGRINIPLLNKAVSAVSSSKIADGEYREIVRSNLWMSYWFNDKEIFGSQPNEEQRIMINFARLYDNAYKHPECPDDKVLDDPILFDGWLINAKEEAEIKEIKSDLDQRVGHHKQTGQTQMVFGMVENAEQARKIHKLNEKQAR